MFRYRVPGVRMAVEFIIMSSSTRTEQEEENNHVDIDIHIDHHDSNDEAEIENLRKLSLMRAH